MYSSRDVSLRIRMKVLGFQLVVFGNRTSLGLQDSNQPLHLVSAVCSLSREGVLKRKGSSPMVPDMPYWEPCFPYDPDPKCLQT